MADGTSDADGAKAKITATPQELRNEIGNARSELANIRKSIDKLKRIFAAHVSSVKSALEKGKLSVAAEKTSQPTKSTKKDVFDLSSYEFKPIGVIKSTFSTKNGTPRQPSLCPESAATLTVDKEVFNNPEHSLECLAEYSHVWLLFVFHLNAKTKSGTFSYKSKVNPPRLNGRSVGVFSTRSPHRPCPIGLSLVKLDKIEGSTVYLSGVDLVNNTPILDIKPYIPDYDTPNSFGHHICGGSVVFPIEDDQLKSNSPEVSTKVLGTHSELCSTNDLQVNPNLSLNFHQHDSLVEVRVPSWVALNSTLKVDFTPNAEKQLEKFHRRLDECNCSFCFKHLNSVEESRSALVKLLSADPRSTYRKQQCLDRLYYFVFDSMHVTCWFDDLLPQVEVLRILPESARVIEKLNESS